MRLKLRMEYDGDYVVICSGGVMIVLDYPTEDVIGKINLNRQYGNVRFVLTCGRNCILVGSEGRVYCLSYNCKLLHIADINGPLDQWVQFSYSDGRIGAYVLSGDRLWVILATSNSVEHFALEGRYRGVCSLFTLVRSGNLVPVDQDFTDIQQPLIDVNKYLDLFDNPDAVMVTTVNDSAYIYPDEDRLVALWEGSRVVLIRIDSDYKIVDHAVHVYDVPIREVFNAPYSILVLETGEPLGIRPPDIEPDSDIPLGATVLGRIISTESNGYAMVLDLGEREEHNPQGYISLVNEQVTMPRALQDVLSYQPLDYGLFMNYPYGRTRRTKSSRP